MFCEVKGHLLQHKRACFTERKDMFYCIKKYILLMNLIFISLLSLLIFLINSYQTVLYNPTKSDAMTATSITTLLPALCFFRTFAVIPALKIYL